MLEGVHNYGETCDFYDWLYKEIVILWIEHLLSCDIFQFSFIDHFVDAPEGQKPGMPINVTVDAVSGGWVIR